MTHHFEKASPPSEKISLLFYNSFCLEVLKNMLEREKRGFVNIYCVCMLYVNLCYIIEVVRKMNAIRKKSGPWDTVG